MHVPIMAVRTGVAAEIVHISSYVAEIRVGDLDIHGSL